MADEFPRRNRVDRWTPAERAIYAAAQEVERAGAHWHLTRAVILLGQARNAVADFVDGVPEPAAAPAPMAGVDPDAIRAALAAAEPARGALPDPAVCGGTHAENTLRQYWREHKLVRYWRERAANAVGDAIAGVRADPAGYPRLVPAGEKWGLDHVCDAVVYAVLEEIWRERATLTERLRKAEDSRAGWQRTADAFAEDVRAHCAEIAMLTERLATICAVLDEDARVFDEYAALHAAKGTPEGDRKASVNRRHAERIRAARRAAGGGK